MSNEPRYTLKEMYNSDMCCWNERGYSIDLQR